ncbi:DUF1127 domain-containing protein [Stappia sp.]|jgi:uncharacterized protein YjiS (DUF1127 family)|uniref:DUF1127 domain-containing protein n=1 Tax=Stappia sp. TaxID=1870903 RepID=UPI003D098926
MTDIRVNQNGAIRTEPVRVTFPYPAVRRLSATAWLSRHAKRLIVAWRMWRAAARTRRALEGLDEAALHDIGLSRGYFGYEPTGSMNRKAKRVGSDIGLWR